VVVRDARARKCVGPLDTFNVYGLTPEYISSGYTGWHATCGVFEFARCVRQLALRVDHIEQTPTQFRLLLELTIAPEVCMNRDSSHQTCGHRPWLIALLFLGSAFAHTAFAAYIETILVTSATDADLINPWGISSSSSSPFWVSDNGTGKATLYNSAGVKQGLIVTMPTGSEPITGQVFNGTASFNSDLFLFASENGTIAGWRGALGTSAEQLFAVPDAVYKGLGISGSSANLFAANFRSGDIDVFDSSHSSPVSSFADPNAPAGYAPFNVQNLNGTIYVTFAEQDATRHDDVPGAGHGFVDTFDPVTHAFTRLVTGSAAGGTTTALDSPWGLALAPATFGQFAGDLLVGNFGNGEINAFNPITGAFIGTLSGPGGDPLVNLGLWGLRFGNGGKGGDPAALYFAAGGADEDIGVFGRITPAAVPEPGSLALLTLALVGIASTRRRYRCRIP